MKRVGLVILALSLGGCVTAAPCLPPGISADFLSWPIVAGGRGTVAMVPGWGVRYEKADEAVTVMWEDGILRFVDPRPDTDEPGWWRLPTAPCAWRRLSGRAV